MKTLFIVAVIAGALLLCGVGSVPAFAGAGAGVSVELETTVVGGGSSGSSGYHGGSGGSYYNPYLSLLKPTIPPISDNDTLAIAEFTVVPPLQPAVTPPKVNPPTQETVSLPQQPSIDWLAVLVIVGIVSLIGVLAWLIIRKRKVQAVNNIP